jgi:hypothetical protein
MSHCSSPLPSSHTDWWIIHLESGKEPEIKGELWLLFPLHYRRRTFSPAGGSTGTRKPDRKRSGVAPAKTSESFGDPSQLQKANLYSILEHEKKRFHKTSALRSWNGSLKAWVL